MTVTNSRLGPLTEREVLQLSQGQRTTDGDGVNLPRSAKMSGPGYQEFPTDKVAQEQWPTGTRVRVIAGRTNNGTEGPVKNHYVSPTYLDVQLEAGDHFEQILANTDNAFLYQVDGDISVGRQGKSVGERTLAILGAGDQVSINANKDSRFLFIAGQPLNEPVVRGGPFVMNSKAEVLQAFEDFQSNRF